MEHPRIEDEKIVDRYLAGRLRPEDEALFEEHLFECADCLEKVEWGDQLRRGLRVVASEDAARAAVSLGFVAWLRSRRPSEVVGLAGLALVLVLMSSALLWQRSELSRARAVSATAGFAEPVGDFLVVSLGVVRAGNEAVEIRPDPEKEAVLLSLELPSADAQRYRVTLRGPGSETLWTGDDLEPNLYETLLVALPSSFLVPGNYRVIVEAISAQGAELAGEIEYHVVP